MPEAAGRDRSAPRARFGLFTASLVGLGVLITLGAVFAATPRWVDLLHLLLPSTAYFAFALLLTRHLALATLAALATFAGAIWSLALASLAGVPCEGLSLGVALASVVSFICIDEFEAKVASDTNASGAALAALRAAWRPAVGALAPLSGPLVRSIVEHRQTTDLSVLGPFLLPMLATLALVPAASAFVRLDERAIGLANRTREWRMQTAYPLTLITVPRWSLSASGIGLVTTIVSYFGAERLVTADNWSAVGSVFASLAVSLALARDWRSAAGLGFSVTVTLLVGLWASVSETVKPTLHAVEFYEALATGFALMIVVAARVPARQDHSAVLVRRIEEKAPLVICAAASALAALLVERSLNLTIAAIIVTAALCALLLAPAVTSAFETVLPRKGAIVGRYGRKS